MSGRDRLHRLVWLDDANGVREHLAGPDGLADLNKLDVRGNSPLHLATILNRKEIMQILLEAGADVLQRNRPGWFPDHEARSIGDRDAIRLVSHHRRVQLETYFNERSAKLMEQLREVRSAFAFSWSRSSANDRGTHSLSEGSIRALCRVLRTTVPLVSHFCPSDVYKFQKKGSSLRVDTTLVGFENLKWVRGNISYMFYPDGKGGASLVMVDHDNKLFEHVSGEVQDAAKAEERINFLMNMPIRMAEPVVDKVNFSAKKSGLLRLGSTKSEKVGEYDAEVFTLTNFKIKTTTRMEHLDHKALPKATADGAASPSTVARTGSPVLPSQSRDASLARAMSKQSLGATESTSALDGTSGDEVSKDVLADLLETPMDTDNEEAQKRILAKLEGKQDSDVEAFYKSARAKALRFRPTLLPPPPPAVSFQEYFLPELGISSAAGKGAPSSQTDADGNAPYIHVGRPLMLKDDMQSVKATLWMSTAFPLFVEQLFPMLEIMSPTNEHFARLKDFIELKLPRGFPVKIEIPLFGVLTAKITFQSYRVDTNLDPQLFVLDSSYREGEVKFRGA